MKLSEVRKKYLDFMKKEGHVIVPSSSIIPDGDATTLFTGSGMQPFVPYLLGKTHPEGKRISDSQKCFRANDIDEVGDNRHTTFFEMLGNWSLGDYFKEKQISMIFEFLIKELKLDPNKLYVTVFAGDEELGVPKDEESVEIWKKEFKSVGIDAKVSFIGSQEDGDKIGMKEGERIFYYDASKNWWSRSGEPKNMPIGEPGGPDTEIFYDFGEEYTDPEYAHLKPHPNTDSGRFVEVCNSVFMEYIRTEKGFEQLKQKNVDFGGGLERFVSATEGNPDIFTIDVFKNVIKELEKDTDVSYKSNPKPFRVIADHLRSALFIIMDGVEPSNTERGYVLRRLIRESIYNLRYVLKIDKNVSKYTQMFVDVYKDQYPELETSDACNTIDTEEEKFTKTLSKGMKVIAQLLEQGKMDGEDIFTLQSTYGIPKELSLNLAKEKGINVSLDSYEDAMIKHKETSRSQSSKKFKGGLADTDEMTVKYHTTTHLLHQALRDVLGEHVEQKGSNITPERLRFDFSHKTKMTDEEKKSVENIVNQKISEAMPIVNETMTSDEARRAGAIGIFEYGDKVSVYSIGNYSKEFCGGPHVKNTGDIGGLFRITKEEAVGSGVRRIKAVVE